MKKFAIMLFSITILVFLFLTGCKKIKEDKISHRWKMIEVPVSATYEVWSFDGHGNVHLISEPSGDTGTVGSYKFLIGNRLRIKDFPTDFTATWDIAKLNQKVMVLTTTDGGGRLTRDFLNIDEGE